MHEAGDSSLPPGLPPDPANTPPPQDLVAPATAPRAKRDIRIQQTTSELLNRGAKSDRIVRPPSPIPAAAHQVDQAAILRRLSHSPDLSKAKAPSNEPEEETSAYMRFLNLGVKVPDSSKQVAELTAIIEQREKLKLSQKSEQKQTSSKFNQKSQELALLALQVLRDGLGSEKIEQEAFGLLGLILINDIHHENDSFLFEQITKDKTIEELMVRQLLQFLEGSIKKSDSRMLFRTDSGWQQNLLRVMHNGYLAELFKGLDKEIKKIRQSDLVRQEKGVDIVHVQETGKRTLECLHFIKNALHKLPPNLLRLYTCVYATVNDKFPNTEIANMHLLQFFFLRAINSRIAEARALDRYQFVEQKKLDKEEHKNKQCQLVCKVIQSLIANLLTQGDEKTDRLMACKDQKTQKTLVEFIREAEPIELRFSLLIELKKLL